MACEDFTMSNFNLTARQFATIEALREKAGMRARDGSLNLVARVRKTRKGQLSGLKSDGVKKESEGVNGSSFYIIREAAANAQGPMRLYCDCPAQRFHSGYGKPCKHTKKLLAEYRAILAGGEFRSVDVIVYDPKAVEAAESVLAA